jgi:hypothetical protein
MRSVTIIVDPPALDDLAGMSVADEQMLVEALVAQPAAEALDESRSASACPVPCSAIRWRGSAANGTSRWRSTRCRCR